MESESDANREELEDQETVIVRDRDGVRLLKTDSWVSTLLQGALSADPRCFEELARAWLRYSPDTPLAELPWVNSADGPDAGPWIILDLACRRLLAGGGADSPQNPATYESDEAPGDPENPLVWINLPPGWDCAEATKWEGALRPLPVPDEPLDVRGVLFGRALAKGIARRTLEIARGERLPAERLARDDLGWDKKLSQKQREMIAHWHKLTIRVHADWLMARRDDLGGEPPRPFLHGERDWVNRELENRKMQWSKQGGAPRPLDRDTFGYRYGPLGLHEVVMYFYLCREVIDTAWNRIVERPDIDEATLTKALREHTQWWLAEGSIDDDPTPPRVIIENERRRMPLTDDGSHLDCDCPICRMEADGLRSGEVGPMFCDFDGHELEMDNEFAFSLCATRDQWEQQQDEFREFNAAMDAKERKHDANKTGESESVWKDSFVDEDALRKAPSSVAVMALAMRVAELVSDLKSASADRDQIESLNVDFDAYRAADGDLVLSAAAKTQLADTLEQIASVHTHLTPKVADLQSQLDERRRQEADFESQS